MVYNEWRREGMEYDIGITLVKGDKINYWDRGGNTYI